MFFKLSTGNLTFEVPDEISFDLINIIDIPPGSYKLDPYMNSSIPAHVVPDLLTQIQSAKAGLIAKHREDVREKLQLSELTFWAENLLNAELAKDKLLLALGELENFAKRAIDRHANVLIFGD